jgi:hypothetical protein
MKQRYETIIQNINAAREAGDNKKLKTWRTKLNKWQLEYGAYAPVQ